MGLLTNTFGKFHWTPPSWAKRLGTARLIAAIALVGVLAWGLVSLKAYFDNKPQPAQVVSNIVAPTITPLTNGKLIAAPLIIQFSVQTDPRYPQDAINSVARIDLLNEIVPNGVTLSPAIAGTWKWTNETSLSFQPEVEWPAGQAYTVDYEPSIFAPNLKFATNSAHFTTPEFSVNVTDLQFYQDPVKAQQRKVVATLNFSHPVSLDALNNYVSYSMRKSGQAINNEPTPVPYTVTFDQHFRTAHVHSSVIDIPPQESYMTLAVKNGLGPINGPSKIQKELLQNVLIPDVHSYFRVLQSNSLLVRDDNDEPQQTVTLEFTDRVASSLLQDKLSVYLLPKSVVVNGKTINNKHWRSASEVTAEILSQAKKLPSALNPVENDRAQVHSLQLDVPENRTVLIQIDKGLESEGEFELSLPYASVAYVPSYPKEAKIAQDGALLPLTGSHKVTFVSRGVSTLRVEVSRLLDDEINHLASQTSGDIKNPAFNNYQFSPDNITRRITRFIDLPSVHAKSSSYSHIDLSEFLVDGGYYFVTVQGWDRRNGYAIGASDRRFVLITDLGLLVKSNADSTQDVFVHSISSGQPVAGSVIELLGKNGLPIMTRTTDGNGHAKMPVTQAFEREQQPTVYIVRNVADSVFMPFENHTRRVQYSRFDIGGDYSNSRADSSQLRAQLFTDRDLYRPGDTTHLAMIVKRQDWGRLQQLPLLLTIRDPRGQTVVEKRFKTATDGFAEHDFATTAASPTGNYNASLFLVEKNNRRRRLGGTQFKVEEFQPDRLKIRSIVLGQQPQGWLKPNDLTVEVTLNNLFGTPAQDRLVKGQLDLRPADIYFAAFEGYRFRDPLRLENSSIRPISQSLTPTNTNTEGLANFSLGLDQYDKGIYELTVYTEGFEVGGGRSVKSRARVMLSPLDYLIGYKANSDLSYITKESEQEVNLVAVNAKAQAIDLDKLTVVINEQRFVSTLVKQSNGTYAYQSISKAYPVSSRPFKIAQTGATLSLPTNAAGRFSASVQDQSGRIFSTIPFTVIGARNLNGNLEKNAELEVALNSSSYKPGEFIELQITAPYTGTGLITIERESVISHKWFTANTNTTVQTIQVPNNIEGNAYVNVSFVRSLDSPEVFISPLSYAVVPFDINRDARTLAIDLDAPKKVEPGDTLRIDYRASIPSRIVVYAVDLGILQVAKYTTPEPLEFFLRKMALQVSTFQMVDLILPEFLAANNTAAPGGGDGVSSAGQNLNPFRRKTDAPVVYWSGIVDAGPQANYVEYKVPDYFNGQLKIMAVAVADSAVGNGEASTVVRGPFVISPNLLTAAAPGDEFEINIGIANNLENSTTSAIDVTAAVSEHLEIVGAATQQVSIAPNNEGQLRYTVRAKKNKLGSASIDISASATDGTAGLRKTTLRSTLSVRPASPLVTTVATGSSEQSTVTLPLKRILHEQHAANSAAASISPLILADGLLNYLDTFPHQCAEQIVSKVFPQIGFVGQQDYRIDESKIQRQFDLTIERLRSRQTADGGFLFWPSSAQPKDFVSVYISHFLTDADTLSFNVPRRMRDLSFDYLRKVAARETTTLDDARLRAYAIYVLTRNGVVTTNYLTNLHEHLKRDHTDQWQSDLAAAYMASSYQLLKLEDVAKQTIGRYELSRSNEMRHDFDTSLGRDAQYLYLLAKHFPTQLKLIDSEQIDRLVQPIMQNRFNTLSSSYVIMALNAYTQATFSTQGATEVRINGKLNGQASEVSDAAVFARAQFPSNVDTVNVSKSGQQPVFYSVAQRGFDQAPSFDRLAEGIEIDRKYLDGNGQAVSSAAIGDELTVQLRIRSTGKPRTNVAIVDLLPGGFEVLTASLRAPTSGDQGDDNLSTNANIEYQDIREDRVVFYGNFNDRVTQINYRVKLTSAGRFTVPSAHANSMYDLSIQARSEGGQFTVERN